MWGLALKKHNLLPRVSGDLWGVLSLQKGFCVADGVADLGGKGRLAGDPQ